MSEGDMQFKEIKSLDKFRREVKVNWIYINYPANLKAVACLHGWEAICIEPDCNNCKRNEEVKE